MMTADYSVIFTSGTESLTVYPQSCSIVRPVCSDTLQHQDGSVSIKVPYTHALLAWIVANDTFQASLMDGSTTIFTGTVSTELDWEDKGELAEIDTFSFVIADNSEKLKKNTSTEIAMINTTVGAVIQRVCTDCGIAIASTAALPSTVLQAFILDEDKSYYTALSNLCFENRCSFYFNAAGELCLFHFDSIPEEPTALDDSALLDKLSIKKSKKKYTGIKIGYSQLTERTNELVYFKNGGYGSDGASTPIVLQPGVYYPFDSDPTLETENGQVYQSYESGYAESITKHNGEKTYQRSSGTTLLYTTNTQVVHDWDTGIVVDRTDFASKKASVRLLNQGATDANLYELAIRADAWYKEAASTVTAGTTDTPYSYDAEYLYTASAAQTLAKILYRYNQVGQYKLTSSTEEYLEPGSYRTVAVAATGFSALALAICSTYNPETRVYTTDWITIGDASVALKKQVNITAPTSTVDELITTVNSLTKNLTEGTATCAAPDTPVISSAIATQNGINATCSEFSAGLKNTIKVMTWQLQKGTDADWVTVGTSTTGSFTYPFDRSTDGYPEASVLKNWSIRASVENIYSVSSEYGTSSVINTDSYGTWIPSAPSATGASPSLVRTVNKRTVTLRMSQPASSTELYGTISYGITIERSNPSADTKFYVPDLTADPYGSVDNYKDASATEPVWVSGSFSQTLPLYGQDSVLWKLQYSSGGTVVKTGYSASLSNLPAGFIAVSSDATKTVDGTTGYITWTWTDSSTGYDYTYAQESMPDPQNTTYLYRIKTKNVTTGEVISTTADVSVTVSPSTVEDIVNAAITENKLANDAVTTDKLAAGTVTAEKIFVKALSAITANLGQMSSGAIFGDANNYHILTEGTYTDPNTGVTSSYKAGEFKVGNSNGDYLQCKNNDDGTYTISLKSSAFQITSTGVDINGTIYTYENTGALAESTSLRRVVVSANGITLQRRESTSIPWSQATDVAKLIGDKYGNLLLTNDSTYAPSYVTPRRATDVIYHLDGNTLDTTGANTEGVDGYGAYETGEVWTPDDKGKELNGFIRKNVGTSTYKAVAFWCKGKKFDACGNIINLNLFTSSSDVTNTNKRMTSDKTEWGLTAAQVSAGVVKYYQD
jgi:hypothetical protein